MKKQYVYPNRSVHIRRKNLGNRRVLRPSKGCTPEGVSFSPTVKHALEGVPYYYKRTRERRVLSKVAAKRIGKIRVKVGNNRWEYQWI